MQSYLDIAKQALQQHKAKAQGEETGGTNNEINESNEFTSVGSCASCLCADYIIALPLGCATCQGAVCARCGGCKRSQHNDADSLIPYPFELTPAQVDARDRLLARLREGSQVLIETQHRLLETRKTEEGIERQFLRWLDAWDGLDYQVRFLYAFKGCVLAPGPCPDDAPIRCRACGKVQP